MLMTLEEIRASMIAEGFDSGNPQLGCRLAGVGL